MNQSNHFRLLPNEYPDAWEKPWCMPGNIRALFVGLPTTASVKAVYAWLFDDTSDYQKWQELSQAEISMALEWVTRHWAYWVGKRVALLSTLAISIAAGVYGWCATSGFLAQIVSTLLGFTLAFFVIGAAVPILSTGIWDRLTGGRYAKRMRHLIMPASESAVEAILAQVSGCEKAVTHLNAVKQHRPLVYQDLAMARMILRSNR